MSKSSSNVRGAGMIMLSLLVFSLQDVIVKWLGGEYSVLQVVTLRSLVALPFTLLFFMGEGGRGLPKTERPKPEYLRGLFLFLSFTTYMMGLAALPLAEVSAIRNSAPLMITLLSVAWLRERVGLDSWAALLVGFGGVLLIVRPGSVSFNLGSIFVLISVLFYALAVMTTRKLQTTDSSATMAYFSSLVYLIASFVLAPLVAFAGETPDAHASIAFLFRAWTLPPLLDTVAMGGMGILWAGGMYLMARAYSLAKASVIAPFEYVSLPISALWGFVLWQETPTWTTWLGAALTLLSGMYVVYRAR